MDKDWLRKMLQEAGLTEEQAEKGAEKAKLRLFRRERLEDSPTKRGLITDHLVGDPLVSFARIIGKGDEGLPFVDNETGDLSLTAFGHVLAESGMDPIVAVAFGKVVVEMYEPRDLYQPLWEGLGSEGEVDLDSLRRMDWSPLRSKFPELEIPTDPEATEVEVPVKPRARPPSGTKKPKPKKK